MPYLNDPTLTQPQKMRPVEVKTATLDVQKKEGRAALFCMVVDDELMVGFTPGEVSCFIEHLVEWLKRKQQES